MSGQKPDASATVELGLALYRMVNNVSVIFGETKAQAMARITRSLTPVLMDKGKDGK